MQTVYYFVLVPMVYIAFAIFVAGTVMRLVKLFRQPPHATTLQIFPVKRPGWLWTLGDTFLLPTVRRHDPVLWVVLMFFHFCIFLLIIGHLELFAQFDIFQIIQHEVFLGRGFVGLILTLSLLYFLFRRFVSPYRDLSVPEDYYLLILLFLTVLFGSQMDWARRWYDYGELGVQDYRTYLLSLFYLKPDLPNQVMFAGHSFMLVLHIFFANLFIMFFPFSKIMHSFLALPINKLRRG
jgi:nitrate reductase gamma subunit